MVGSTVPIFSHNPATCLLGINDEYLIVRTGTDIAKLKLEEKNVRRVNPVWCPIGEWSYFFLSYKNVVICSLVESVLKFVCSGRTLSISHA